MADGSGVGAGQMVGMGVADPCSNGVGAGVATLGADDDKHAAETVDGMDGTCESTAMCIVVDNAMSAMVEKMALMCRPSGVILPIATCLDPECHITAAATPSVLGGTSVRVCLAHRAITRVPWSRVPRAGTPSHWDSPA